ncbi:hypothetical protein Lac2_02620 [Claveliimonas bilis]|uniref:FMN-binding protein n=1 Tax=Claveliimonas TaxID=3076670 RepID=UPI00292E732B|nr:hypothetical protein [Claveliimonas bilis]BDZ82128.1 hypothetical protein Lac2_02620 [Claveliimonas bilis]
MSSKTKIFVLHMKEIIYTAVFAVLAIVLILLLVFMFLPGHSKNETPEKKYKEGVYTSSFTLNNTELEVEVSVDESQIDSIRFSNMDETVDAMFPLVQPAMEDIAQQICETQSLENIQYSEDSAYTSQIIIGAIKNALKNAEIE